MSLIFIEAMASSDKHGSKPVLFLSDNGPDFNPMFLFNSLFFYQAFKYLDLDLLSTFTYAAQYSYWIFMGSFK